MIAIDNKYVIASTIRGKDWLTDTDYYFLLPNIQRINPTTTTTRIIAVQNPALKIPPITSQEDKVITNAIAQSQTVENFFIKSIFYTYAKALPPTELN